MHPHYFDYVRQADAAELEFQKVSRFRFIKKHRANKKMRQLQGMVLIAGGWSNEARRFFEPEGIDWGLFAINAVFFLAQALVVIGAFVALLALAAA